MAVQTLGFLQAFAGTPTLTRALWGRSAPAVVELTHAARRALPLVAAVAVVLAHGTIVVPV